MKLSQFKEMDMNKLRIKSWIDFREPPKALLNQVKSKIYDSRWTGADDLGNYAHEKSVEALLPLIEDERSIVRHSAILALARILTYKKLSKFKITVGRAIAPHLWIDDDVHICLVVLPVFITDQIVLDEFIGAFSKEVKKRTVAQQPYLLNSMIEAAASISEEDKDYVLRKIIEMDVIGPNLHWEVVTRCLYCINKLNLWFGLIHSIKHLQSEASGGYRLLSYKRGNLDEYKNRHHIRGLCAKIFIEMASKPEKIADKKYLDQIKLGLAALIDLTGLTGPRNTYMRWEDQMAQNGLWSIYHSNSKLFTEEILGEKIFNSLPQKLLDKLKSP